MATPKRGRPPKDPSDLRVRINISLSANALALLDLAPNRSAEIERLVLAAHMP